jgi:hypothetical protein
MNRLKELVALGDSTAFAGYTLSPPRLIEFAEAEEEAAAQYLRRVTKASATFAPAVRAVMHERAVDNLRTNPFAFGSAEFDQWALSVSAVPFLAWLLLRIKHPKLTPGDVSQLLCGDDRAGKMSAVWSLWGFEPPKKTNSPPPSAPAAALAPAEGSTGAESSPDSLRDLPQGSD